MQAKLLSCWYDDLTPETSCFGKIDRFHRVIQKILKLLKVSLRGLEACKVKLFIDVGRSIVECIATYLGYTLAEKINPFSEVH